MASVPNYTYRQPGITAADLVRLTLLASPVGVLALLLWNPHLDPQWQAPAFHFVIVTLAAGVAAMVGVQVLIVAERLREARALMLGLAFTAIAGFIFIHGLLTPGFVIRYYSNGIGWAPLLALFLGAVCLSLSTVRQRPGEEPWVFRYRKAILISLLAAWTVFLVVSLAVPNFLAGHPTSLGAIAPAPAPSYEPAHEHHSAEEHQEYLEYARTSRSAPPPQLPWLSAGLVIVTGGLLLSSALRYARNYRLSRLPLHATIVAGIVLLIESLIIFFLASVWRASWWEYHVLIVLGITTILYGLLFDYRRDLSLTRTVSALFLNSSVEALEQSYSEVLTGLVAAVEAKDPYTKGHSEKVARLATEIGERLGLSPERLRVIYQAGLLHDIGKIGIADEILNKPGQLTAAEFAVVKGHPARSEEMIGKIPSLRSTLQAIRWHHERLDGSGYPDGIAGDEIPLDARILAVADVYDAMVSGRSYRPALGEAHALAFLQENTGLLFDPRCVDAVRRIAAKAEPAQPSSARAPLSLRLDKQPSS
jgi:HD-GYP domain-containing protein (c-di-GMP phosphodiesterase class II)